MEITSFNVFDTGKEFTKKDFANMKKTDINALVIYLLFMLGKVPEYKVLIDILFIMDYNMFLKLCEYFGGTTVTLPTLDELMSALTSIKLYSLIEIDGLSYEEAILEANPGPEEIAGYFKLKVTLENYGVVPVDDNKKD